MMQPDNYSQTSCNAEQSPKNGLKNTAKLHKTSSKATVAVAPEDVIHLPNPEHRQAAGNVIRRRDNTAPVAPPPRSFRQAQTPLLARHLNRDRGNARKLGQNDGEDSGSDSDKNRKPVRSGSSENAKKPPQTIKAPQGSSLADSEMRVKEESERLELLRTLRLIGHRWTEIDQRRKSNAYEGRNKKTDLLRHSLELKFLNDNQRFQYSEKCRESKTWDDKTSTFIKTALRKAAYGNALGNRSIQRRSFISSLLAVTPLSSPPEVITMHVEAEVIWRLNIFSPAMDYGQRDSDVMFYLTHTIETLYLFLWCCMPRAYLSSIESVIDSATQLMQNMSEESTAKGFINTLVDAYMFKIIRGFADLFFPCLQPEESDNPPDEYETLQLISRSRENGRLIDEYIAWTTGGNADHDAQERYMEGLSRFNPFKVKSYESLEDTRQEFIMNPSRLGVVSLILLKGTNPVIVRDISTAELSSLGWFSDDTGLSYWRYKIHSMGGEFGIFKVSMDDEVLEAWRPDNEDVTKQNP